MAKFPRIVFALASGELVDSPKAATELAAKNFPDKKAREVVRKYAIVPVPVSKKAAPKAKKATKKPAKKAAPKKLTAGKRRPSKA